MEDFCSTDCLVKYRNNGGKVQWKAKNVPGKSENITTPTKPGSTKSGLNTEEVIQNTTERTGKDTGETGSVILKESSMPEKGVIQQSGCVIESSTLKQAASDTMSLIDSSANHLHALMRGLTHNVPDFEIKTPEPHRVETAVKCASEIRCLMRLKLDLFKTAHQIQKGN
jgi:hypothetical protein